MGRDHFQGWRLAILRKWDGAGLAVSRRYATPPRFRRAVGYGLLPNLRNSLVSLGESAVLSQLSGFGRNQHPRGVPERSQSDRARPPAMIPARMRRPMYSAHWGTTALPRAVN
jgi:hypothetical protein